MEAKNMTFGIEIECLIPRAHIAPNEIGGYHHGIQLINAPQGWNAQHDGSIRTQAGYLGVEVVSPVLRGEEGLIEVVYMIDYLNSIGAKVNSSCGLHVHIGAQHLDTNGLNLLKANFRAFERAFYGLNGSRASSRWVNPYCVNSSRWTNGNRYQSLNLNNLANRAGKQTVEVRCFYSSLNVHVVVSAIYMSVVVVTISLNPNDGYNCRIMNAQEGMRALTDIINDSEKYRIVDDQKDNTDIIGTMHQQASRATLPM